MNIQRPSVPITRRRLDDKVALITGTGGGQGRAAALLFAAEGATVVGCDLVAEGADETLDMVRSQGGRMTSTAPIDLGDETQVANWIASAAREHGTVDILYNNAGGVRFAPIEAHPSADWAFTLRNELDLVFFACKHAWPHLRRQGGSIVNVASTAALRGSLTLARPAHAAAKGGVLALSRQLAAEGAGHGIRVNCISPGVILTPATQADIFNSPDHPMNRVQGYIPLGRLGAPEEIVRCALFLASDDASYVTGANLVVDGGLSTVLPGAEPTVA